MNSIAKDTRSRGAQTILGGHKLSPLSLRNRSGQPKYSILGLPLLKNILGKPSGEGTRTGLVLISGDHSFFFFLSFRTSLSYPLTL